MMLSSANQMASLRISWPVSHLTSHPGRGRLLPRHAATPRRLSVTRSSQPHSTDQRSAAGGVKEVGGFRRFDSSSSPPPPSPPQQQTRSGVSRGSARSNDQSNAEDGNVTGILRCRMS
ncbi:hypothetical protein LDENG_00285340 [Lucifuga dentata]|nr:hypothetical protein LDENG_00285340 [Lucifuga dentata]